jgi:hypothetical protein
MTFLHFSDDIHSFLNAAEAQGCWESESMTVAEYPGMRWQAKPRRKPAGRDSLLLYVRYPSERSTFA